MAPKGVSLEEKRRRILAIFKDNPEVYSLKEIEQIGTKKGVVTQTIKDIVKGLCDDGLVDTDKIGSGNFFWALPSKDGQRKRARLDALNEETSTQTLKKTTLEARNTKLSKEREDSQTRQKGLLTIESLKKEEETLQAELQKYQDRDPAVLAALKDRVTSLMEDATRWGFNLSALVDYIRQKQGSQQDAALAMIGATEDDIEALDWEYYNLAG